MNLTQAEQWADNWATDTTSIHNPLVPLMTEYHRRGRELERLLALLEETVERLQLVNHALDAIEQRVKR